MKPIHFNQANITFAKDQPEYLPLPAYADGTGELVSCWKLTFYERLKILLTGRLWLWVLTFNQPLQPQLPSVEDPFGKK